ncbi:ubiE [Symbiodinium sp. CCMP2592]|nr:ubiE [Symbiodinium sp. CCMP2592]
MPAVRPLSLYAQPVTYSGGNSTTVLLNRRPVLFWNRQVLFNSLAELNSVNLRFRHVTELTDKSFGNWLSHRAGVYYPYDWLQTMAFYDWVNMGLPTFVPDTPMYTFTILGTNDRNWIETIFDPPKHLYPYEYRDWEDLENRVYWWHMTDFKALPSVRSFTSAAQLFTLLLQESMVEISAEMRQEHLRRTHSTAVFWQQALLTALRRDVKGLPVLSAGLTTLKCQQRQEALLDHKSSDKTGPGAQSGKWLLTSTPVAHRIVGGMGKLAAPYTAGQPIVLWPCFSTLGSSTVLRGLEPSMWRWVAYEDLCEAWVASDFEAADEIADFLGLPPASLSRAFRYFKPSRKDAAAEMSPENLRTLRNLDSRKGSSWFPALFPQQRLLEQFANARRAPSRLPPPKDPDNEDEQACPPVRRDSSRDIPDKLGKLASQLSGFLFATGEDPVRVAKAINAELSFAGVQGQHMVLPMDTENTLQALWNRAGKDRTFPALSLHIDSVAQGRPRWYCALGFM